ncbi:MAG: DUF3160 domain-containing protein [Planctomycetes bacterium]|nr:DUF3160 domain-containing protein [Planctomycetota bacterium]MCW8136826.1 DUF3160 domain-containing protein [Planctomycetota bacterium]
MTDPNLHQAAANVVRTAREGSGLSESELVRLQNAIQKESPMQVAAPIYRLPQVRIPASWLMYAAAVAMFAIALLLMSVVTPPGAGPALAGDETPDKKPADDAENAEEKRDPAKGVVDLSRQTGPAFDFFDYYKSAESGAAPDAKQYTLPLDLELVANGDPQRIKNLLKNEAAAAMLRQNGFVVLPTASGQDIGTIYSMLRNEQVPVVVTPDVVLHLFHICFDETLKDLEEQVLAWDMLDLTVQLLEGQKKGYEQAMVAIANGNLTPEMLAQQHRLADAHKHNVAYLSVAHKLLGEIPRDRQPEKDRYGSATGKVIESNTPTISVPDYVFEMVNAELKLMEAHKGPDAGPVFGYKEDYSQYVPRGHYTRSELLKKYFKAMMWYGRMTFLFNEIPRDRGDIRTDPPVTRELADRLTLQAALLAHDIEGGSVSGLTQRPKWAMAVKGDVTVKDLWVRVYSSTAFFVGAADDLTPAEYHATLGGAKPDSLADTKVLRQFMQGLEALPLARIYGGTAGVSTWGWGSEMFNKALKAVQGMRMMGQRYIPDSEALGRLVYPSVTDSLEHSVPVEQRFTYSDSNLGPIRGMPRGLDVMYVLGSDRAMTLLEQGGDAAWTNYFPIAEEIRRQWDKLEPRDWNQNLYYGWLYTLKPLLQSRDTRKGYPTYMQTQAYEDRAITAALASWAQLRHDTILYAKQSYTSDAGGSPGPRRPPRVLGYVEPLPEFYGRMESLCAMMMRGLAALNILSPAAERRLERLTDMVKRLHRISNDELQNKELPQADYDWIRNFADSVAWTLQPPYGELDPRALRTDIVADVHTDGNSKQVLEVGTGKLRMCAIAYLNPDGDLLVGFGPVLTYHEFRHPMSDRLTDEKWQKMLESGQTPPDSHWIKNFTSSK